MSGEGFAAVPNWMIRDETISLYAITVYAALASHAGPGGIHPSRDKIAREARCSVRQVSRALAELEVLEVVVRVRRKSALGQAPNGYELRPNGRLRDDEERFEVEDSQSPTGEVEDSGDRGEGLGVLVAPYTEEEPNKNLFDEFWAVYPRRAAKGDAVKAWSKLEKAKVDLRSVVAGAARYAADPNLPPKTYVPYPATWLNGARWDDEPLPQRAEAPAERVLAPGDEWMATR